MEWVYALHELNKEVLVSSGIGSDRTLRFGMPKLTRIIRIWGTTSKDFKCFYILNRHNDKVYTLRELISRMIFVSRATFWDKTIRQRLTASCFWILIINLELFKQFSEFEDYFLILI